MALQHRPRGLRAARARTAPPRPELGLERAAVRSPPGVSRSVFWWSSPRAAALQALSAAVEGA
eukprot:12069706-Alexandrium_andersonii.AAC.1